MLLDAVAWKLLHHVSDVFIILGFLPGFASVPQVCTSCSPVREYVRLFDVTERTSLHRHGTDRRCSQCGSELRDTIVHFGERGTLEQPLNWKGAAEAAKKADVILCLGSSLKVGFIKLVMWILLNHVT